MMTNDCLDCLKMEFDVSFVEEAVFIAVKYNSRGISDSIIQDFHDDRECVYQNLTDEDRNASFEKLYKKYFDQLGIREIFERTAMDFPFLHQPSVSIFIKKVWSKSQEDAELYVDGDFKKVCIALMANRVLNLESLQTILRHELLRISDMLDSHFQYDPYIPLEGKSELENNLIRDRFRILWDMYIDIRLKERGFLIVKTIEEQKGTLERAFSFMQESERENVLSKLKGSEGLKHNDLLGWAQDARSLKALGEGGLRCPLCDFTSYEPIKDWLSEMSMIIDEIKGDHPQWAPSQGICPQCFDLYSCRIKMRA